MIDGETENKKRRVYAFSKDVSAKAVYLASLDRISNSLR